MFFGVCLAEFWCGLCVLMFCFVGFFVYLWGIFSGFLGCVVCLVAVFVWLGFFETDTDI